MELSRKYTQKSRQYRTFGVVDHGPEQWSTAAQRAGGLATIQRLLEDKNSVTKPLAIELQEFEWGVAMLCAHAIICCTVFLLSRSLQPSYYEMDVFWHVLSRPCLHCVPGQLPGQLQETAAGAPCTAKRRRRVPEIVETRSNDTKSNLTSHYPNMFHHVSSGKCLGLVVPQCPKIARDITICKKAPHPRCSQADLFTSVVPIVPVVP